MYRVVLLFGFLVACHGEPVVVSHDASEGRDLDIVDGGLADLGIADAAMSHTDAEATDVAQERDGTGVDVVAIPDLGRDVRSDEDVDMAAPCVVPVDSPAPPTMVPALLSQTGLYEDVSSETLADGVRSFEPRYALWSDGATKERFVWLPPCEKVDNTDQDYWSVPVGTRLWKTFTRDGVRVETRWIARFGPGSDEYLFGVYLWRDDGSDADFVEFGVTDAKGTEHNVPAIDNCEACHGHLPEAPLGFGAIMLSHQGPGATMATLSAEGRLEVPAPQGFEIPGPPQVRDALGYLHANCSNCHNESAEAIVFQTPFSLRTLVTDAMPEDTGAYRTAVGQYVTKYVDPSCIHRVNPGAPDSSCIHVRMSVRGGTRQMPVIGTEIVDSAGLATVADWISGLP